MIRKHISLSPFILLLVVLIYVGVLGVISIDFGNHWDEGRIINTVKASYKDEVIIPMWYNYPSITFDIALITSAPKALYIFLNKNKESAKKEIKEYILSPCYKFLLRYEFFLLAIASGLFIYFLAGRLSENKWIGLFAALTLITSPELIYHARWVAPDAILMFFLSCSLASQYQIFTAKRNRQRHFWIVISSILAGLCVGAKYPGGLIIFPLLIAIDLATKAEFEEPVKYSFGFLAIGSLVISMITFVATTPGIILQPVYFISDVLFEIEHYKTGHGGYTVSPGPENLIKMLLYFIEVVPSKNVILSITASTFAFLGIIFVIKTKPKVAVWLLSLPVLYILYMMLQKVLIVRNYLLLFPIQSILISLGIYMIGRIAWKKNASRFLILGFSFCLIIYNLSAATTSSFSIFSHDAPLPKEELKRRIASSPDTMFYLSPACVGIIEKDSIEQFANVTNSLKESERFIFVTNEVKNWALYKANERGRYHTIWAQMDEVNWDYYPTWQNRHRILEVASNDLELKSLMEHVIQKKDS